MVRTVKREPRSRTEARSEPREEEDVPGGSGSGGDGSPVAAERRVLRSRYLAVKNLISDEREEIITSRNPSKFNSIFAEVESLHQYVQKPREQVADAEALLDIASTLMTSVKSHNSDGTTPAEFVSALLRNFGQQGVATEVNPNSFSWSSVGFAISDVLRRAPGCCTMIGPMSTEIKQRKAPVQRKRTRPTDKARPEELDDTQLEERTDTDKNMSTMFDILRRKRRVRLENLVLNRISFAQTVENIFALSFLVKDGRAEVTVKDKQHFVSPRNAPAATAVASGQVSFNHFVFRFDFKDWKLMKETVQPEEELMPHRSGTSRPGVSHEESVLRDSRSSQPTTPIRKLSRNRGLVIQEQSVVEDTPDKEIAEIRATCRRSKRLRLEE